MRKYTDNQYDDSSLDESLRNYYQHVKLSDIVNDFIMSEVGDGMLIPHVKQSLVEFHAQRGLQELNYDTLKSVKSREYSPEGSLSVILPQDFVSIVGVFWVDDAGYKHPMAQRQHSGDATSDLLSQDGERIYSEDGERLEAETSQMLDNYNSNTTGDANDEFYNYYAGSFENDELYDRYYSYYGRRFGLEPSEANLNGTYIHDEEFHKVLIDPSFANAIIVIDYISDGIIDFETIKVHKFAEEAIYAYIRFKLVYSMRNIQLYEKQLVKKEYSIAKRRAKHRLSDLGESLSKTLKNKGKWIKH